MKLNFKYAKIYDEMLALSLRKKFTKEHIFKGEFKEAELQTEWDKQEKKIVKEIQKISGLKFKNNYTCYIVNHCKFIAISEPLTLRITKEDPLPVLIHELCHILLEEHNGTITRLLEKKYPTLRHEVKIHIPVLLITKKVLETIKGKEYLKKEIKKELELEILDETWPRVNKINLQTTVLKYLKQ